MNENTNTYRTLPDAARHYLACRLIGDPCESGQAGADQMGALPEVKNDGR